MLASFSAGSYINTVITDGVSLAVLRGFQGIGGAATIPSAVQYSDLCVLSVPDHFFSSVYWHMHSLHLERDQ